MTRIAPLRPLARRNQAGMVSIMVTMIMMLVISLIVLGFAQVSRREQRQQLDRQLSVQAFLAAESGVNDARTVIQAATAAGNPVPEKPNCATRTDGSTDPYHFNPTIDSAHNVSYTCLLVTSKVQTLTGSLSNGGNSMNLPLQPDPPGAMQTLHVNWNTSPAASSAAGCSGNVPPNGDFPQDTSTQWTCPFGVLRMDIVPTDVLSDAAMRAGQRTIFFYPTQGGGAGSIDFSAANGQVVGMKCAPLTGCDADITNMASGGSTTYAMRLSAIYVSGNFTISAKDAGGLDLYLKGAQIQVDSTGKAEDVMRRIQVRLPAAGANATPDYALESGSSICKRFSISSTSFEIPADIKGQDPNNPMCKTMAVSPPPQPCTTNGNDIAFTIDSSSSMNWAMSGPGGPGPSRREVLDGIISNDSGNFIDNSQVGVLTNHEAVITWNKTATVDQDLTPDATLLHDAVNNYTTADWTHFTEGLKAAYGVLVSPGTWSRAPSPKVVIFITDGAQDDGDTPQDAYVWSNALKNAGVTIYTIGIATDVSNVDVLKNIASVKNGVTLYTHAFTPTDIQNIIEQIRSSVVC